MRRITTQELTETVLRHDYCSGCGICTATENSPFTMQLDRHGRYFPVVRNSSVETETVCPFASHGLDEKTLAEKHYGSLPHHPDTGYYTAVYAGYVQENGYRQKGSSGGLAGWVADQLLQRGETDYVLHVKDTGNMQPRFAYGISRNIRDTASGRKSKYYPVTMENVLQFVRENPGRYTVTGLPCFIKGIRLLQEKENLFAERIVYTISLFCGHLKTTHYLSSLIAQFGVDEKDVVRFDFRHKLPDRPVNDYATLVELKDGTRLTKPNKELFGTDWGWGLFKLKACDFCDDMIGETADISIGDAWLPEYANDWRGTNIAVVRNPVIAQILENGMREGKLKLDTLRPEKVYESQAAGYRHKREGLAYRLFLEQQKGRWTPIKRIKPALPENKKRRKIYDIRMALRERSFYSPHYADPEKLKAELMPLVKKLRRAYEHSRWTRWRLKIKSFLKSRKK